MRRIVGDREVPNQAATAIRPQEPRARQVAVRFEHNCAAKDVLAAPHIALGAAGRSKCGAIAIKP
jgi:hypothetical protein